MPVIMKPAEFRAKDMETGEYIDVNVVGESVTTEQVRQCLTGISQPVFGEKQLVFNVDGTVTWIGSGTDC